MVYRLFFIFLLSLCVVSFASGKDDPPPAGVESRTVEEADSLAKLLFGEEKTENRARKYFEHGKEDFEAGEEFVHEADSMQAAGVDTTLHLPSGVFGMIRQAFGDSSMSSKEMDTRKRATSAFKAAKKNFKRALKESPEMKEVELWLAATLERLKEWNAAVILYRDILDVRQGEHRLWFNFGYAAMQDEQFDKAVTGFVQAIRIFALSTSKPDSTPNRYRIFAAEAFLRTYQDKSALEMFRDAQAHADTTTAAELQKNHRLDSLG